MSSLCKKCTHMGRPCDHASVDLPPASDTYASYQATFSAPTPAPTKNTDQSTGNTAQSGFAGKVLKHDPFGLTEPCPLDPDFTWAETNHQLRPTKQQCKVRARAIQRVKHAIKECSTVKVKSVLDGGSVAKGTDLSTEIWAGKDKTDIDLVVMIDRFKPGKITHYFNELTTTLEKHLNIQVTNAIPTSRGSLFSHQSLTADGRSNLTY